jgi:type IV secretory pathway VirB2 component (pilin)
MRKILFILLIFSLLISFPTKNTAQTTTGTTTKGEFMFKDLEELIRNIAVAAAVLMIVIGGFQWMTSAGDPGKIAAAKEKIYSAILGLLIIALASTIAYLVGGK